MGKLHKELKRAEKEFTARKREQLAQQQKPSRSKKKACLILFLLAAPIFGGYYFKTRSIESSAKFTTISKKLSTDMFPSKISPKNQALSPALGEDPNLLPIEDRGNPEQQQQQQVTFRSESAPGPAINAQRLTIKDQAEDQKSEVLPDPPAEAVQAAKTPLAHPDPPVVTAESDEGDPPAPSPSLQKTWAPKILTAPITESKLPDEPTRSPDPGTRAVQDEKEEPPDPGKLIDWLLKKRSMEKE
jgi:hypothetical protein